MCNCILLKMTTLRKYAHLGLITLFNKSAHLVTLLNKSPHLITLIEIHPYNHVSNNDNNQGYYHGDRAHQYSVDEGDFLVICGVVDKITY